MKQLLQAVFSEVEMKYCWEPPAVLYMFCIYKGSLNLILVNANDLIVHIMLRAGWSLMFSQRWNDVHGH